MEKLFRGKREDDGKWIISKGFLKHKDGTIIMIQSDDGEKIFTTPIIPITLGQLRYVKGEVKYFDGDIYYHAGFGEETVSGLCKLQFSLRSGLSEDIGEITGNIYD